MAAGFTIDMAHFDAFREFMNDKALAAFDGAEPVRELRYDSAIAAGHCTLDLINWLDLAAPTAVVLPSPVSGSMLFVWRAS